MTTCFYCDKELYPGQTIIYTVNGDGHFCDKECAENFFQDEFYGYRFGYTDIA